MDKMLKLFLLTAVYFMSGLSAQALIVGGSAPSQNSHPFGGVDSGVPAPTRYQQVYNSSQFSGPVSFSNINFFESTNLPEGNLASGTFEIHFSTTSTAVDALDTTVFNNNVGADDQLFTTAVLTGGAAPSVLSFSGSAFTYDPAQGNLLMDIIISGFSSSPQRAFFQAYTGGAGGVFSRAQDSGTGTSGFGLTTEFVTAPVPVPAAIWFLGSGLLGLLGFRRNNYNK